MQFRRFLLPAAALLLATGIVSVFQPVSADVVIVNPSKQREMYRSRAAKLRTNTHLDPDTVWIGHINDPTWIPKRTDGSDVPGVPAGGYGPFKVGRGPNLPGLPNGYQGVWDFDRYQAGENDSLQGWWPVTDPYGSVGGSNAVDRQRAFFGLDYGNQGNYVITQGNSAGKRTFGVTGYWHRDPGNNVPGLPDTGAVVPGPDVEWPPLAGGFSAWCGLRAEGDLSVQDDPTLGGTGNYFNAGVLAFNGNQSFIQVGSNLTDGTDHNFPGYGSQMDQMLYRDVILADNAAFNLSFKFRTNMSDGANSASNTRVGWFDKDPLAIVALNDGNFISSSDAGLNAPVDSFMVYIGVPVNPVGGAANDFTASDGITRDIYDLKRRWFSEVIAIDKPYRELFTTFGVNAAQTKTINVAGGAGTIVQQILDAQAGAGGTVRLVFRVKTNRGFDDADYGEAAIPFSSLTAGPAIVDDVVVNAWAAANGDFEASGSINNDTATLPTAAWKSTGKPPGVFFHRHSLTAGLPYDDPCGAVGSANRICNMAGGILTPGDHDAAEKPGGLFGANDQDRQKWAVSPTINLMSPGEHSYNAQGIDAQIADVTGDIWLHFDVYVNLFQFGSTANGTRIGWQSYPAMQPNGAECWGEVAKTIFFSAYDGTTGCGNGIAFAPAGSLALTDGLIITSNANGIPDSLRAYIEQLSICFRRPVTGVQCSPSSGPNAGGYYDNCSIGFIDGAAPPEMSYSIWDVANDCFPTNGSAGFAGTPAFDTLAARVQIGFNTGRQTGNLQRNEIPGDSMIVTSIGDDIRTDLIFRILPGVGNYSTIGNRGSRLRKRPDAGGGAGNQVLSGDGSFWGSYMANNGPFGGTNAHNQAAGIWDPNTWHSARMDTAEANFFPCVNVTGNLSTLTAGIYVSQYHESEVAPGALRNSLGIAKNRCFLVDVSSGASTNAGNINCGSIDAQLGGQYPPPAWQAGGVPVAGTGLDDSEDGAAANSLPIGQTYEFTKVIPDGQLTPGAHVQYFYRKASSISPATPIANFPDTFVIFPNAGNNEFDGTRWFHFGVLPDRWKDTAFGVGGTGMACMLVVDLGNRRGDELTWVSMSDSIGLTQPNKYGAHNGWHARGDQDITLGVNPASAPPGDPTMAVRAHGGQPGSKWDLYQVVGGESNVPAGRIGSRSAGAATSNPPFSSTVGKTSTHGPTGEMLRTYYNTLIFLAADLGQGSIGPVPDQTANDIGLLTDFITNPSGGTTPRSMIMVGRDLVEGQATDHPTFFPTLFGASFRSPDYRQFAPNTADVADLIPVSPVNTTGSIYGVFNPCFLKNDVLNIGAVGAQAGIFYQNAGASGPHIAAVYFPDGVSGRISRTLVAGWTYGAFGGTGSRYTLTTGGHNELWWHALTNLATSLACGPVGTPIGVGEGPVAGSSFVNFMNLRSENPVRSGEARIAFGVTKTEKVEVKVFDVTGRLVKTLANRVFAGGKEHVVTWDGTNDAGHSVARGVYFYQLRSPSFTSQKKLAVLSN